MDRKKAIRAEDIDKLMEEMSQQSELILPQAMESPHIPPLGKNASVALAGPNLETFLDYAYANADSVTEKSQGTCVYCQQSIIGSLIEVKGCKYHAEHVFCSLCQKTDPEARYFEGEEKIICFACNQICIEKCSDSVICNKCKKPIVGDNIIVADTHWHLDCLTCHSCGASLESQQLCMLNEDLYCNSCAQNFNTCIACNKPIVGQCLSVNGVSFHVGGDCFSCKVCKLPVGLDFYNIGGIPYCKSHYMCRD